MFQSTDGISDPRGLEYGDADSRRTWQGKVGLVLSPLGTGIYTRPSIRILYGAQHSSQNNAFGNSFVESLDDYLACFTEDATWGGAGFPERKGHAAILAGARERRATGTAGPGSQTRHLLSTAVVEVAGDRARSRSIFLFYCDTKTAPRLDRMGVWEDGFARTPAGWKLASPMISQPE